MASLVALSGCGSNKGHAHPAQTTTVNPQGLDTDASADAYTVPPQLDPHNVYAADRTLSLVVRQFRPLVYVPNSVSNTVDEIDPTTYRVIREFPVGALPQHVVPAYDLRTLWVTNDDSNSAREHGECVAVDGVGSRTATAESAARA